MILKIFTQPNCPKCSAAKKLAQSLREWSNGFSRSGELKIEEYDVSTVNGLAEASFYSVLSTPSLILTGKKGKEIKSWRGEVPKKDVIAQFLLENQSFAGCQWRTKVR